MIQIELKIENSQSIILQQHNQNQKTWMSPSSGDSAFRVPHGRNIGKGKRKRNEE